MALLFTYSCRNIPFGAVHAHMQKKTSLEGIEIGFWENIDLFEQELLYASLNLQIGFKQFFTTYFNTLRHWL